MTTKFIGIKAIRKIKTHRVGTNDGVSKIVTIKEATEEKPTIQNPLEIRLPAKAIRRYHLKSSWIRKL